MKSEFYNIVKKGDNLNDYYFSNCLIEALKHYIKQPFTIKIKRRGDWRLIRKHTFPHFYWYDMKQNKHFHFSAKYSDEPFLYQLWFKGKIEEFHYHDK